MSIGWPRTSLLPPELFDLLSLDRAATPRGTNIAPFSSFLHGFRLGCLFSTRCRARRPAPWPARHTLFGRPRPEGLLQVLELEAHRVLLQLRPLLFEADLRGVKGVLPAFSSPMTVPKT